MRGGKREGAGRPKGTFKSKTHQRARRQVCAFDDEWNLIKQFAEFVKHGNRAMCEEFITKYKTK